MVRLIFNVLAKVIILILVIFLLWGNLQIADRLHTIRTEFSISHSNLRNPEWYTKLPAVLRHDFDVLDGKIETSSNSFDDYFSLSAWITLICVILLLTSIILDIVQAFKQRKLQS